MTTHVGTYTHRTHQRAPRLTAALAGALALGCVQTACRQRADCPQRADGECATNYWEVAEIRQLAERAAHERADRPVHLCPYDGPAPDHSTRTHYGAGGRERWAECYPGPASCEADALLCRPQMLVWAFIEVVPIGSEPHARTRSFPTFQDCDVAVAFSTNNFAPGPCYPHLETVSGNLVQK